MNALIAVIVVLLAFAFLVWLASRRPGRAADLTSIHRPSGPSATLKCIAGPQQGRSFPLTATQVAIGRTPECDVIISSDHVSRRHALIACENDLYTLYDQDSTNGTWVNGQRIVQHILQPHDQIQVSVHDIAEYQLLDTRPGGAATVYQARSQRDGQIVALKVLHSQDPYIRDKFVKEIEVGKTLRHPHIVCVYGGGNSNGSWYMVMEFMEGGTLRDRMRPGYPLPWEVTVQVIGQMCDALVYAHQRGVYHRDIKPENILFASPQVARLGDFGIARLAQSATRTAHGMIVGTPLYMSFEQAKGHPIDHRTDIYSLGVVLYEMTTGRPPFMAEEPLAIVEMHIRDHPTPPRQVNSTIPPQAEQVIARALAKDRQHRFQSAEEMARALGYTAPMYLQGEVSGVAVTASPSETSGAPTPSPAYGELQLVRFDNVTIPLEPDAVSLDRKSVNPGDDRISRQHAQVIYHGGCWWLQDMDSTNGTYVNGLRIFEPVMLQPGDEIRLGSTVLRVMQ
jgi:serine/threonine protein kinase